MISSDISHLEQLWQESVVWLDRHGGDILFAMAAAAALVLLMSVVRSFGMRACRNDRLGTGWPGIIGRVIGRTRLWFMVALAAELVADSASPPDLVADAIRTVFIITAAFQGALWVRELVLGLIDHRAGSDPENQTLGSAKGLIRLLVTVALFAIALVLILDNLGVNVTGLVAGLGIGGIAIGLAAQGIFSDLFAALSIIFDKPFRLGDLVSWESNIGVVEKIGLKTTRLRSITGEQIIVSNAALLQKELRNLTNLEQRRISIGFGLVYQTPPETCARIPALLEKVAADHGRVTFVRCTMAGFGASSLDFEFVVDALVTDPREAAEIRSALCLAVLGVFNREGIAFAYPTQTTYTAGPDGRLVMPWAPPSPH